MRGVFSSLPQVWLGVIRRRARGADRKVGNSQRRLAARRFLSFASDARGIRNGAREKSPQGAAVLQRLRPTLGDNLLLNRRRAEFGVAAWLIGYNAAMKSAANGRVSSPAAGANDRARLSPRRSSFANRKHNLRWHDDASTR